jgi:hypothetical protein
MLRACNLPANVDTEDLIGGRAMIEVSIKKAVKDSDGKIKYKARNEVQAYYSIKTYKPVGKKKAAELPTDDDLGGGEEEEVEASVKPVTKAKKAAPAKVVEEEDDFPSDDDDVI